MQTFLPYQSFEESAKSLDRARLGKQRVEAYQIVRTLTGQSKGWAKHPAVTLWKNHEAALCVYGIAICQEWIKRGYKDNLKPKFLDFLIQNPTWEYDLPDIIGDQEFHVSHQSNLIRKFPEHYIPIFGNIPADLPYVWVK